MRRFSGYCEDCPTRKTTPASVSQGGAVGQDGRSSSLTAPNGPAQQALVAATLAGGWIGAA